MLIFEHHITTNIGFGQDWVNWYGHFKIAMSVIYILGSCAIMNAKGDVGKDVSDLGVLTQSNTSPFHA